MISSITFQLDDDDDDEYDAQDCEHSRSSDCSNYQRKRCQYPAKMKFRKTSITAMSDVDLSPIVITSIITVAKVKPQSGGSRVWFRDRRRISYPQ